MEGTKCCQSGCSVHDFLPFECPKCEQVYCLEHRSRFVHDCHPVKAQEEQQVEADKPSEKTSSDFSVKKLLQSVTDRFKPSTSPPAAAASHHQIHSSKQTSKSEETLKFENKLQKLEASAAATTNEKTKRINAQTRQMLVKSKAKGNENCVLDDRIYFVVHFEKEPTGVKADLPSSGPSSQQSVETTKYVFFPRYISLGEFLSSLRNSFADLILFLSQNRFSSFEDIGLGMTTRDTLDWRQWDRTQSLEELFSSFEEISVFPLSIEEILVVQRENDQKRIERRRTQALKMVYKKEDAVWYYRSSEPGVVLCDEKEAKEKRIELIAGRILAVHHDDFPNIYYTIELILKDGEKNEKQTDASHLIPRPEELLAPAHAPVNPSPGPGSTAASTSNPVYQAETQALIHRLQTSFGATKVLLKFSHRNKEITSLEVGSGAPLTEIRELVSRWTAVPKKEVKLICKGMVLKDGQTVQTAKLTNGSRIVIMGG
jgi:hypothetical protein